MSPLKNTKGFTLIELLVVVAIIALLVGIMVPAVQEALNVATDGVVGTQLHNIGIGLEMFKSDNVAGNGDYPASDIVGDTPDKSGAELLCDALMGTDLKGYDPTGAYGVTPRRGPFIKTGTVEFEVVTVPGAGTDYIMKDKWEMPIIYYRATPGVALTAGSISAFYTEADNTAFITGYPQPTGATNYPGGFTAYITDTQIPSMDVPYNPDSFILISAGRDKIYGNEDDVFNFERRY